MIPMFSICIYIYTYAYKRMIFHNTVPLMHWLYMRCWLSKYNQVLQHTWHDMVWEILNLYIPLRVSSRKCQTLTVPEGLRFMEQTLRSYRCKLFFGLPFNKPTCHHFLETPPGITTYFLSRKSELRQGITVLCLGNATSPHGHWIWRGILVLVMFVNLILHTLPSDALSQERLQMLRFK